AVHAERQSADNQQSTVGKDGEDHSQAPEAHEEAFQKVVEEIVVFARPQIGAQSGSSLHSKTSTYDRRHRWRCAASEIECGSTGAVMPSSDRSQLMKLARAGAESRLAELRSEIDFIYKSFPD